MDEKELENFRQVIQGLTQDLQNLGTTIGDATGKASSAAAASQKSSNSMATMAANADKANKIENEYQKPKEITKQAIINFGKSVSNAAQSTENSQSKYASSLSAVGDAVGSFVGQFGILGKVTEKLINGFTLAAEAVMKQNDAIFKSYNDLAKFGVTLNTSTEDVLQLGIKAGYSSKNLESLYKSAKSLDTGLVQLGGSTSNGVKAFAEIANVGEETRNNFRALGYSQEDVTEMQATYVKQLGQTGGLLAKTPRQLSEESQKYINNLTALAELTGKNVKEQQKAQEVALQQRNLNAYLNNLEDKRVAALANGNKAEAERLEKQVASTKAYAAHVVATEDAETAAAKLESMSTDGAVIMTKNNAQLAGMGYNFDKVNEALRRGESPMKMYFMNAEENNKVQKNAKEMFGENLYRLGETSVGLQKFAGQSNEARAAQAAYNKYLTLSEEERKKIDSMTAEEAIAYLTKQKQDNDSRTDLERKRQEAEREFTQAMDQLTSLLSKFVNPALGYMFDVLKKVGEMIKWVVETIHTLGDGFDKVSDLFDDFVMGMRENAVTRKLFGLKEVGADERKQYDEDKAKRLADREKSIAERKAIYQGTAAPAEAKGTGESQAQAIQLKGGGMPGQTALLAKMQAAGITDPKAQANILAQIQAESGGVAKSESLKYSPERLMKMFPKKFSSMEDAQKVAAGGEESIGNRIYGGRMGNAADEGYKYRGRGLVQLTGKDNYAKYGKILGIDLAKNPDLANDPDIAQRIAVEYFKDKGKTTDLTNISAVGKAVGYVDVNGTETAKRSQYAQSFLGQLQGGQSTVAMPSGGSQTTSVPQYQVAATTTAPASTAPATVPFNGATAPTTSASSAPGLTDMMKVMENKFDTMIAALNDSNSTQQKILQYSRV